MHQLCHGKIISPGWTKLFAPVFQYKNANCQFYYGGFFTDKTIIVAPYQTRCLAMKN